MERIIAEQMLPRTEQQEIIRKIRQQDFKLKAKENSLMHSLKSARSTTSSRKSQGINMAAEIKNQVEVNEANGYSPK